LPRVGIVPQQRDDAEQHRRRAKDDPPEQRARFVQYPATSMTASAYACGAS
jgi:hypothetical protein